MRSLWTIALSAVLLAAAPVRAQSDAPEKEVDWRALAIVPANLDEDARVAVDGINSFSLDLYRRTIAPEENHLLSPASVSVAMALAYRAAGGATADEMRRFLHYTAPPAEYLRATEDVLASMNFKQAGRELATANSIWIDRSVGVSADYLTDMAALPGTAVERFDFRGAPADGLLAINGWVEERTGGRIKDLLAPSHVTAQTRSILVNAIYLKANWVSRFPAAATRRELFRGLAGDRIAVPLMRQTANFQVLERDGVKAILLPYQGGELEMAVFLPNFVGGLPRFEAQLSPDRLSDWFARLAVAPARYTDLALPRMHLSWGGDLKPTFQAMGMTVPFSMDADFSAIATPQDKGTLAIGAIVHKTYLDLDEEGSEAAAATTVLMNMVTGSASLPPKPFIFRADRPFFFVLRDQRTGLICFMGRFVKPESGS
jgi:serpin B